jgi:hypothetical protein
MLGAVAAAWEREDVNAILSGVFDLNAKLLRIGEDVGESATCSRTRMKKKRKTTREILGAELVEQHERTQRILAERIAYHRALLEQERRAAEKHERR